MANYQKAYYHLMAATTKAAEDLIKAQLQCESICVEDDDEQLSERLLRLFNSTENPMYELLVRICSEMEKERGIIPEQTQQ